MIVTRGSGLLATYVASSDSRSVLMVLPLFVTRIATDVAGSAGTRQERPDTSTVLACGNLYRLDAAGRTRLDHFLYVSLT
jgi:hypothetical protein